MKEKIDIGVDVKTPENKCQDKHCPFHGSFKIRGFTFTGKVVKADTSNSATVEWPRLSYLHKYERYEKKRSKVRSHNPPCINAKIGDEVKIIECRPISKTKKFVIVEKITKK